MVITDKTIMTSDGYFKDPHTKKDLTLGMPRVKTNPANGKAYTRPYVLDSKGNPIPIAYTLWTKEEKAEARAKRGNSSGSVRVSQNDEKLISVCDAILKACAKLDKKDLDTVQSLVAQIRPKDAEQKKAEREHAKLVKTAEAMTPEQKAELLKILSA